MRNVSTCNNYLNIMAIHGLLLCINNFTRLTNHSKTCIDHVFIKNINDSNINSNILRCDITDNA